MKFLIYLSLAVSASLVGATVQNSDGQVGVDPIFDSPNASILITGDAAEQLYKQLDGDGGPDNVKVRDQIPSPNDDGPIHFQSNKS